MAGHSKWAQIKHQKATTDAKRGDLFSKLTRAIGLAAREGGTNQNTNAKLRDAIAKAKQANMPADNIQRAIERATAVAEHLKSFLYEAYGPGGAALLIEGTTDNGNRSANEIKHLLGEQGAKWAEPGSVKWAFEHKENKWEAREHSKIVLNQDDQEKLEILLKALDNHDDVENVYENTRY